MRNRRSTAKVKGKEREDGSEMWCEEKGKQNMRKGKREEGEVKE